MKKLSKGYIQVYTGNGKGKTTAAIGLGVRAAGNDLNVFMVQFLKGSSSGELNSAEKLEPNFKIFRFDKPKGFVWNMNEEEKKELKGEILKGYEFCMDVVKKNLCDLLILDEIIGTLNNGLISEEQVIDLLDNKPETMEIVLTGRDVPEKIFKRADLVTEMRDLKHYFNDGVPARKGIEF